MLSRLGKNNTTRKNLWTLAEGKTIGYIENVLKEGIVFKNECIYFRETSSNLSNGQVINISTTKCSTDKELLQKFMMNKTQICVDFHCQLFSFPTHGTSIGQNYATKIEPIGVEVITVQNR
jgi:hypothetical protein